MKKTFFVAISAFAFALMFSLNYQNGNIVENSAFAGQCCHEEELSICNDEGFIFHNHYLKKDNISIGIK